MDKAPVGLLCKNNVLEKLNTIIMKLLNQEQYKIYLSQDRKYRYLKRFLSAVVIGQVLLALFTITSCSSDDDNTTIIDDDDAIDPIENVILPTLKLESGSEDLFLGIYQGAENGGLQHVVAADVKEGLKSLKISKVQDGMTTEYENVAVGHPDFMAGMTSFNYQLNYVFDKDDVNTDLSFLAELTDEKGNTATLEFGNALVKLPMLKASVSLSAKTLGNFSSLATYYLKIKENEVKALTMSQAKAEENDSYIAAILNFNADAQFYLASPTDVNEPELTDGLLEISRSKFKYDKVAENELNADYNLLDTHEIEGNYEQLLFAEKDERLEDLKLGNRFYIKTQDERIAVLQVLDIVTLGPSQTLISFDIIVTQ